MVLTLAELRAAGTILAALRWDEQTLARVSVASLARVLRAGLVARAPDSVLHYRHTGKVPDTSRKEHPMSYYTPIAEIPTDRLVKSYDYYAGIVNMAAESPENGALRAALPGLRQNLSNILGELVRRGEADLIRPVE